MQITYYGLSCFRVATKPAGRATDEVVIYTDPINEKGVRAVYGKADIALCSQGKENCSLDSEKGGVTIFDFPGEYSLRGVNIIGTDASTPEKPNTIFTFESEGIRITHLGRLGRELTEKQLDTLSETDILFVPIGGGDFLSAKSAISLLRKIEPKIVIPMLYTLPGIPHTFDSTEMFLSEMGVATTQEALDKFICKEKDLEEKKMEIVILASQR